MLQLLLSLIILGLVSGNVQFLQTPVPKYGGYDVDLATDGLYFSAAAYCTKDSIQNWNCGSPCEKHADFKVMAVYDYELFDTPNQVFTGYCASAKRFIISFQGTQNPYQLVNEGIASDQVTAKFANGNSYKLEQYFWKAYLGLQSKLQSDAKQHTEYEFLITGHSLGGALANICSMDLVLAGIQANNKLQKYTFGEPRTGDDAWAAAVDKYIPNAYRVIHYHDIVPHLPFQNFGLFKYEHSSQEIWYNEASTNYTACAPNDSPACSNSVPDLKLNVPDHMTYLNYPIAESCGK